MTNEVAPADMVAQTYELGYLLTPLVAEDQVEEILNREVRGLLTRLGAEIEASDLPKMISLAYPIKQIVEHKGTTFREAYFGFIRFTASGEVAEAVRLELKKSSYLIRFLIVVVPPVSTRSERKPTSVRRTAPVKVPVEGPSAEAEDSSRSVDRVIDREIDNLVELTK